MDEIIDGANWVIATTTCTDPDCPNTARTLFPLEAVNLLTCASCGKPMEVAGFLIPKGHPMSDDGNYSVMPEYLSQLRYRQPKH